MAFIYKPPGVGWGRPFKPAPPFVLRFLPFIRFFLSSALVIRRAGRGCTWQIARVGDVHSGYMFSISRPLYLVNNSQLWEQLIQYLFPPVWFFECDGCQQLIIDFSRSYLNVSKRWLVHFAAAVSVVSATISCLPCQAAKLPGESRDRQTSKERRRRRRRMRSRRSRSCDCNPESTQREREGGGAAAMRTSVTDGSERPWHFLHFSNCCGGRSATSSIA